MSARRAPSAPLPKQRGAVSAPASLLQASLMSARQALMLAANRRSDGGFVTRDRDSNIRTVAAANRRSDGGFVTRDRDFNIRTLTVAAANRRSDGGFVWSV